MDEQAETRRRAEAGDADAMFQLAAWALTGEQGEVDLARARELFLKSGEAGRLDGAVIYVNFMANGTGGPSDWMRAIELLRRLVPHEPRCARDIELIERMALSAEGDPLSVPDGEWLSEAPRVKLIRQFFTDEECDFLAQLAEPMLQPAMVKESADELTRHPGRTSDSVGFTWPIESPVVHALNRRIAAASETDVDQGEPLQVLRYRPGQEYRPHFDAIPGFANQRIITFLVWLNDDYDGGETAFLKTGLKVKGRKGDALMFRNVDESGQRDENSAHAGLPVTRGEKWLASRWIRAHPLK
ncbi:MAG TPA: 2OG-Fe(II) oxygenase [Sphingomicrobium sp.]|nr:2OG-Fe(II) oxygenase [Sphingomicrobium sp.]